MKLEFIVLIYSMINNLIIALMKIIGGLSLGISLVLADGLHTFTNSVTDGISLAGAKLSRKKATKHHPYGFGRVEYLANLFIGIILLLLGIFIIVHSLGEKSAIPPVGLIYLLVAAVILKITAIIIMNKIGEKKHSHLLSEAVGEAKIDLIANISVILIAIILQFASRYPFLEYVEVISSLIIAVIVIKKSLETIIHNSFSLLGEVVTEGEIVDKIREYLNEYKEIEDEDITLIKYGSYYKLQLDLDLDNKLTLRKIANLENKIRTGIIRHRSLKVKHVSIYVTNKID